MTAPATQAFAKTCYTVAEYHELENASEEKWEFSDGEVYRREDAAGLTPAHVLIATKVSVLLNRRVDPDQVLVFGSDFKLHIPALRLYRYPDASVACDKLEVDPQTEQAYLNPTVLVEVASTSSFYADYTTKAEQYMTYVPSLRDYLIVVQHEPFVTLQSRESESGAWKTTHVSGLDASIHIPSVDVTLALREIYRNIVWVDGEAQVGLGGGQQVLKEGG